MKQSVQLVRNSGDQSPLVRNSDDQSPLVRNSDDQSPTNQIARFITEKFGGCGHNNGARKTYYLIYRFNDNQHQKAKQGIKYGVKVFSTHMDVKFLYILIVTQFLSRHFHLIHLHLILRDPFSYKIGC